MQTTITGAIVKVSDVEKAVAFYSQNLGAEVVRAQPGQNAELKIGQSRIYLVEGGRGVTLAMSAPDLDSLRDSLTRSGCDCLADEDGFTVTDPDGNQIALRAHGTLEPSQGHGVPWNPQDREEDQGLG